MKQKDIAQQLGNLINQSNGAYGTIPADDSIPSELKEPDPLFTVNYNDEQSVARQQAYETIKFIVRAVVPDIYVNDDMIQNKMKIDAYQLGMLLYQQTMNNIALQTAMDVLAKGDTQPRMFEVIDKLQKRASDLSGQITELQNQFRKYYIDSYLDLQSREIADLDIEGQQNQPKLVGKTVGDKAQKQLPEPEEQTYDNGSVLIQDSKQLQELLEQKKREKAKKAKQEAENAN